MSKSSRLRLADVRAAFRLVGDCRDLGHDPAAWNAVLVAGLSRLLGGCMSNAIAVENFSDGRPAVPEPLADDWPDPDSHKWFLAYHRQEGFRVQPTVVAFVRSFAGTTTRRRDELVPTREWVTSAERNEVRGACRQDELVYSAAPIGAPGGRYHAVSVNRPVGERVFTARERNQLALLHEELRTLFGTRLLFTPPADAATGLSARAREVLAALVGGDTEKQVAARLGLSRHTVHEYVGALYRRFGVRSRAALVSAYLRAATPPGK